MSWAGSETNRPQPTPGADHARQPVSASEPAASGSGRRSEAGRFLPGTRIELIDPDIPRGRFHSVLFDFDGTLSLVREGWQQVMIPMMVQVLKETGTDETEEELYRIVREYVTRLTGRQTIYQMIRLAEEVRKRGAEPLEPLQYKHRYHELLWQRICGRMEGLKSGRISPEQMTVPGTHKLLEKLYRRGLMLYLASGTDLKYVLEEAAAIGVAKYFGPRIFGALDEYKLFSKRLVVERILSEHRLSGPELLSFGDGFVEIEEVKRVGGVAVGVASDERHRVGLDDWKRDRLIEAGADFIVPDYREQDRLFEFLFGEKR